MTSEEIEQRDEIGTILQKARLERGENLSQGSSNLRIRQVYLEAIENNQFDHLPGIIYVIGFIRSYSEYLNLDAEVILKQYKESTGVVDKKQELEFPVFVPENGLPGSAILLVGLMIAFFGYASWYFLSNQNQFEINQVPHIPSELETLTQKDEKNKNVSNKINESSDKFKPQDKKQITSETNNQKLEPEIKKTIKDENSPVNIDENSTIKTIDSRISATKEDSDTEDVGTIKPPKVKVVEPNIKKVESQETSSASQSQSNRESNISEINKTPEIGVLKISINDFS